MNMGRADKVLHPAHAGGWGLARTAHREVPSLSLRCAQPDAAPLGTCIRSVTQGLNMDAPFEAEVAVRAGALLVPRLTRFTPLAPQDGTQLTLKSGTHLLLGGTGGLGLLTARWLGQQGAGSLVLASRSGAIGRAKRDQAEWIELRKATSAPPRVEICCAGDLTETRRLFASVGSIRYVWHSAGILADGTLPVLGAAAMQAACAPKSVAAWQLHAMSARAPLNGFVLFSSVSTLLGSAGQANYAAANGCLDALSRHCNSSARSALSVQWGCA